MFNINEKTCKPQIGMNEKLKNYDKKKASSQAQSACNEASLNLWCSL